MNQTQKSFAMSDIVIKQEGKEVSVSTYLNKDENNYTKIKQIVLNNNFDWLACDLFIANFPENSRYLCKTSGRTQINSGG